MEEPDPDNGTYYDGAAQHTAQSVSQLSDGHIAITTTLNGNNGKEKSFQAMFAAHAGGKVQILSTEAAGPGQTRKRATSLKFSCY